MQRHEPSGDFGIRQGFLFKYQQLCVPKISLREHLIREMYAGSLLSHADHDKTITLLEAQFFWPAKFMQHCGTYQLANGHSHNQVLCIPLPNPSPYMGECFHGFYVANFSFEKWYDSMEF